MYDSMYSRCTSQKEASQARWGYLQEGQGGVALGLQWAGRRGPLHIADPPLAQPQQLSWPSPGSPFAPDPAPNLISLMSAQFIVMVTLVVKVVGGGGGAKSSQSSLKSKGCTHKQN